MDVIDLQRKARPKEGSIEHYWFENAHTGLARTLFHRIIVPFEPFDSGLDYVPQPESTSLVVEWINLGLGDPSQLDGVDIAMGKTDDVEASIYVGHRHNWTELRLLTLRKAGKLYEIQCSATVEFENEGVAKNEGFEFTTTAEYRGEAE